MASCNIESSSGLYLYLPDRGCPSVTLVYRIKCDYTPCPDWGGWFGAGWLTAGAHWWWLYSPQEKRSWAQGSGMAVLGWAGWLPGGWGRPLVAVAAACAWAGCETLSPVFAIELRRKTQNRSVQFASGSPAVGVVSNCHQPLLRHERNWWCMKATLHRRRQQDQQTTIMMAHGGCDSMLPWCPHVVAFSLGETLLWGLHREKSVCIHWICPVL